MAGFNDAPIVRNLAVPAVCALITFLAYGSQIVFHYSTLDPGPPSRNESIIFNTLLLILWFTYFRAITIDPGRYDFKEKVIDAEGRWCNKCNAPKPHRSHHCRHCGRCIPKMDHHCPWTRNCVSMTTFPHFLRFLIYTNLSLWYLGYLLFLRFQVLWDTRLMPAYLGPSLAGLISLSLLSLVNFFTTLLLGIMLITTLRNWVFNQTMIEGWEIERHEAVGDRGGRDFWDIVGPDGEKYHYERLEFPYDIGFFANMAQAMGTSNVLLWLWPLSGHPRISKDGRGTGWDWEENGFNRIEGLWPPLDPEKIRKKNRQWPAARRDFQEELRRAQLSPEEEKAEFQKRQAADDRRRRMLMAELEEVDDYDMMYEDDDDYDNVGAPEDWKNSDGERLQDFGVDEETELAPEAFPDEDVPLAELLRRRRTAKIAEQD